MSDAEVIPFGSPRRRTGEARCRATTATGRPCRNHALEGSEYCAVHSRHPAETARSHVADGGPVDPREWIGRRLKGDYSVDDFGLDEELLRTVLMPILRPLYERWFRVETVGLGRVPEAGPALLVANHSGTIALDSVILQYAVAAEHPTRRIVRNVGADLVYQLPFVGPLARKSGAVVAHDDDALELLGRGELVGVFPEGFKGVGKGWRERYRLQRFGRGGFIQLALRARVPIVPVAIVGAEEAYPMIGNIKPLASLLGLPYFPITPTWPLLGPLGVIPLPSKWLIEFGEPLETDGYPDDAADDAMLVFDLSDEIRDRIQQMLVRNLKVRGPAYF